MDVNDGDPKFESPFQYSEQKFSEVAVTSHLFSHKLGVSPVSSLPQRLHMSPSGEYIVAVTRLDNGQIARYSFIKK